MVDVGVVVDDVADGVVVDVGGDNEVRRTDIEFPGLIGGFEAVAAVVVGAVAGAGAVPTGGWNGRG